MKYIFSILIMSFFLNSCNSQDDLSAISTKELKVLLAQENIQLIDVRSPEEIEGGAIETAIFSNYFNEDFFEKAAIQLDKTKPVYVVCKSGNRSSKAAKILKEKGYDVVNVLGGYTQWKKEN